MFVISTISTLSTVHKSQMFRGTKEYIIYST